MSPTPFPDHVQRYPIPAETYGRRALTLPSPDPGADCMGERAVEAGLVETDSPDPRCIVTHGTMPPIECRPVETCAGRCAGDVQQGGEKHGTESHIYSFYATPFRLLQDSGHQITAVLRRGGIFVGAFLWKAELQTIALAQIVYGGAFREPKMP
jgi:hypothetical protein